MQYSDLIEKKKHGTPDFPVEYYYIDKSHPRYVMATHWHKEFELIRVLSGSLRLHLNTAEYHLSPNECILVEGGCLKSGTPKNCVYECLVFDTAILGSAESSLLTNQSDLTYRNFIPKEETKVLEIINHLFTSMREENAHYQLEAVSLLCSLFYQLHTLGYIQQTPNRSADSKLQTVISLIKWIEKNNRQEITLEKISQAVGLSEKYLCRLFKTYTSKTIMDYVNESRIERACDELKTASVTEAAFNCGFNNLSYFCKIFKKYKSITPREYKKEMQKHMPAL